MAETLKKGVSRSGEGIGVQDSRNLGERKRRKVQEKEER